MTKLLLLPLLLPISLMPALTGVAAAADSSAGGYSDEQLAAHHYTLYYADAGDGSPSQPDAGDVAGLFQSVTDQAYGVDPITGSKWGYGSNTGTSTSGDKYASVRYYSGSTHSVNTAVNYSFELPEPGDYYVSVGVKNPWSARNFSIVLEGSNVSGDLGMPASTLVERTYNVHVSDGELNVAVKSPSAGPYDQWHDPMVGLITVQTAIPLSFLQAQMAELQTEIARTNSDGTHYYTSGTIAAANAVLASAHAFADSVSNGEIVLDSDAAQIGAGGIRDQLGKLAAARTGLIHMEPRTAFLPGQVMRDTDGNVIDAHGPGFLFDEHTGKYYWYGEYHNGVWPGQGVRVYSSTDLYNWKDEGMALTLIKSMDDFANDPLISQLYAGRTDTYNVWADIRAGRIIERPKVIYNDKTHKYVMWAHIDGDKNADNNAQNYGKAQAGYAISDSPTGPFVYQRSYRMDMAPPDQTDYFPQDKGMARDMNLFKDDDGTAYLIYSSEENRTIYISKLLDDYSDVAGWHKDGTVDANGSPVRDTTYKAVYGTDYVRVFPGGVREAPAVFKYNGKYYLLTSGATGWSPNVNMYSVADSMLGPWSSLSDPFVRTSASDPDPKKAFNSQTSAVIPVDAAKGKFIYVGDDWNGGSFGTNGGAKYVWLPIEFGQDAEMTIKWYSSWTQDLLDKMAGVRASIHLPEVIAIGTALALPSEIPVTPVGSANAVVTPVAWSVNSQPVTASTFAMPGTYNLDAKLPAFNNKVLRFTISAIPEKTVYWVNSGGQATSDYNLMASYMQHTLINKSVVEQAYNPDDSAPWGYVGTQSNPAGAANGDIFSTLRYLNGGNVVNSPAGTDLTYKFAVHNGSYTVYSGFNDIWNNSSRRADLYINGVKKTAITYIANQAYAHTVNVTDGTIDVTVRNTAAQDPLINWILIADNDLAIADDPLKGLQLVSTTTDSASLAWDKGIGAASYTLYRSTSENGPFAPVYAGSAVSYTDSGIDPAIKYYYKVSSTSMTGESALSDAVSVLLDQTPPSFELSVNGQQLRDGDSFDDSMPLTFRASDDLSGVAAAQIMAGDTAYIVDLTKGTDIAVDLAGKPGIYDAVITVEDAAGNKLRQSFRINVTTSIDAMNQLLTRYEASFGNPMSQQLHNALDQAHHKLDMNRPDQAVKHMEDFVKHLNNASVQVVDSKVKSILIADAQALIAEWSGV